MTPLQRPRCAACWGDGFVHCVFTAERLYCDACDGTGYDLYHLPGSTYDKQFEPRRVVEGDDKGGN